MKYENNQILGGFAVSQRSIKRYIALVENNRGYQQLLSIDAVDTEQAARFAARLWERKGKVLAISAAVAKVHDGAALPLYEVKTEVVVSAVVGNGYQG